MMRTVKIGDATLIHGDAREVLPTLGRVDAVVTDPPYGIGEAAGKAKTRPSGFNPKFRKSYVKDYGNDSWDDAPIPADPMKAVISTGRHAIVFGGNYYRMPPSSCWLVWDKLNGDTDFADCELAWTNLRRAVRRIRYLWNGALRANGEKRGHHPTQKPIGVMQWCIGQLPREDRIILDPFMGSGTTGIAALGMRRQFIGIERERKYFDIAVKRVREAHKALQ